MLIWTWQYGHWVTNRGAWGASYKCIEVRGNTRWIACWAGPTACGSWYGETREGAQGAAEAAYRRYVQDNGATSPVVTALGMAALPA